MRLLAVLAFTAFVATAIAQTPAPTTPAPTTATCLPTATLDQLIAAIDDAISGPANKDRSCFRKIFLPDVRLIPVGAAGPHILTVDDWITAVAKNGDAQVSEQQIKFQSETFGHIAHLWSTYSTVLAGKPLARGINSIQAVYDGQNWHIIEILWQAENATEKIPAQYLP